MAQRHSTQLVDDLDGTEASTTVRFALNDRHYELDLSTTNLDAFRRTMSRYLTVARPDSQNAQQQWQLFPVKPANDRPLTPEPATKALPEPTFDGSDDDIRLWAQRKRMVLGPRGRIPREIEHAYSAAAKRIGARAPAQPPSSCSSETS
jgi:hypothetical protein